MFDCVELGWIELVALIIIVAMVVRALRARVYLCVAFCISCARLYCVYTSVMCVCIACVCWL